MKFSTISAVLAAAGSVAAAPAKRQDSNIDVLVLQFALTLEHLENYFYSHALRRIPASAFTALGFDKSYYTNLRYIASDEKSHVALLTSAIKSVTSDPPVLECKYNFSDNITAAEFITLSSVLEGVGTSAYLGGAPLITSKAYLTVAGSILVTEALHTSLQRGANKLVPFANPYGTPIDPNSIYTLAANFIVSCPERASSLKLGFQAHPALTSQATGPVAQASQVTFTSAQSVDGPAYLTFVSGLNVISVLATAEGSSYSAAVPSSSTFGSSDVSGQTYVFLTSSAAASNTLANIVAGPAILEVLPAAPCFLGQPSCGVA